MQRLRFDASNEVFARTPADSPFLPPKLAADGRVVLVRKDARVAKTVRYERINGRMQPVVVARDESGNLK